MEFNMPCYVNNILNKLKENDFEGFLVGGSIRDLLLGIPPHDFDISTNALPNEILNIFKDYKTLEVGKTFGTIVVVQGDNRVEVTTYRRESEYLDGRRPSQVEFTNDLLEDLGRRDFTINALAYNKESGLIDYFNGRKDLEDKIIRTVGNPEERFKEDHLRILRGVRLASQLVFDIDKETTKASKDMGHLLGKISVERIREELFKIILSKKPSYGLELIRELRLMETILPEMIDTIDFNQYNPHHDKDVFYHSLCVLDHCPPILDIRLAGLFHDIGKPKSFTIDQEGIGHFYGHDELGEEITRNTLSRLKSSNELINKVTVLVREHMTAHNNYSDKGLKRLINRVGEDGIFKLLSLQKADKICSAGDRNIDFLIHREERIKEILEEKEVVNKNQLALDGHDLLSLGFPQGKIIGEILEYLLDQVMDYPELNNKGDLLSIVKEVFKE